MYQYRQILVRMRRGDSDRDIARSKTMGRKKIALVREIAFEPPILPDQTDAPKVVQLHLEHRLVRRLLSRFLSQGFQSGLERVTVVVGPGAQPRVVLLGRLARYGPGAARLHEEILPVTALWVEATRGTAPLRPYAERGEGTTLAQLEQALRDPRRPAPSVIERVRTWAQSDAPTHVCGGIGSDESVAIRAQIKDHPLSLLFARPDGAYLILGGLGDLGLSVAAWLAERGAKRLLLLNRTGLPDRSEWPEAAGRSRTL